MSKFVTLSLTTIFCGTLLMALLIPLISQAQNTPPAFQNDPPPVMQLTSFQLDSQDKREELMLKQLELLQQLVSLLKQKIALMNKDKDISPPFQDFTPKEPVACASDAMLCPDGSSVGRVGPSCEFAACPADPELPISYGQDAGKIDEYRADCDERGGEFNECASACDGNTDPNISCAAVCIMTCS